MDTTPNADVEAELTRLITKYSEANRFRRDYDQWLRRRLRQEDEVRRTVEQITAAVPLEGKRVLEIGCGLGGLLVALARRGVPVTGLDVNAAHCEITRLRAKRYGLDVDVTHGDGQRLAFPDASFDVVFCFDVLEHTHDPRAMLQEIRRVLRPGGVCLITIGNRYGWYEFHYQLPFINWLPVPVAKKVIELAGHGRDTALFSDVQAFEELRYFTFGEFHRLANELGFTVDDVQEERLASGKVNRESIRRGAQLLNAAGLLKPAWRAIQTVRPVWYFKLTATGAHA